MITEWFLIAAIGILVVAVVYHAYEIRGVAQAIRDNQHRESNVVTEPVPIVEQPAETPIPRPEDTLSNRQLSDPPMIGNQVLRDWLIHNHRLRDGVWPAVVSEFYIRAARVPEVASYFAAVLAVPGGMENLQKHFTRALMMITGQGVSEAGLRYLQDKHAHVRDEHDRPIDAAIWDMVVATLVGILVEQEVPAEGIDALGRTLAPIRESIVHV